MKQWNQSHGQISGENIVPAREKTSTGICLEILETIKRALWPIQSDREDLGKGCFWGQILESLVGHNQNYFILLSWKARKRFSRVACDNLPIQRGHSTTL